LTAQIGGRDALGTTLKFHPPGTFNPIRDQLRNDYEPNPAPSRLIFSRRSNAAISLDALPASRPGQN
jgi:hypothetical protein